MSQKECIAHIHIPLREQGSRKKSLRGTAGGPGPM